jgi:hypothetical protein
MARLDQDWIGSVSSGTLREQDLIPAFEAVLDIAAVQYDRPVSADKLLRGWKLTGNDWEEVGFYLNEILFDLLNDVAPEGSYFGAHPGDGADFGFWEQEDEDEEK